MQIVRRCLAAVTLLLGLDCRADLVLPPAINIDVTAVVDPVAPGEGVGYAAVGFDGTDYWVARWASARFTRLTQAGAFVDSFEIPGLTGTRAMTWDGTHFWMANNTNTLSRVNPVTKTVVSTITVPQLARYATYDAAANGGLGGFWIGNFTTDIQLVDMTGTLVTTLPAANISFAGRYGLAVDRSGSSPILWVFNQGGPHTMDVGIIDLPSGVSRPEPLDLFTYTPSLTSGLAGGAFVTTSLPGGQPTLLTLTQGTPNNLLTGMRISNEAVFQNGFE